jgi:hypothetical protein
MNSETITMSAAIAFGILNLGFSLICYRKQRGQRDLLEFAAKQIEDLEYALTKNKEIIDANGQRATDQARRIAWLEARVRQPKPVAEEIVANSVAAEPQKTNITERRHRVMALASRGQDAATIAGTLGIMPGEVELIVNLSKAAAGK